MPKISRKNVPQNFIDAANTMSTEELRQQILKATAAIEDTLARRDGDETLSSLKEKHSVLASGYAEVLKVEKAKIGFLIAVLKDRGQQVYVDLPSTTPKAEPVKAKKAAAPAVAPAITPTPAANTAA
jgi:hypothetical protein